MCFGFSLGPLTCSPGHNSGVSPSSSPSLQHSHGVREKTVFFMLEARTNLGTWQIMVLDSTLKWTSCQRKNVNREMEHLIVFIFFPVSSSVSTSDSLLQELLVVCPSSKAVPICHFRPEMPSCEEWWVSALSLRIAYITSYAREPDCTFSDT